MNENTPEPWLRGPLAGVHPLIAPVFFSFVQVREDLRKHTAGISRPQLWTPIGGQTLGFHLKHIAGSADRLATYLTDSQLTAVQLQTLKDESQPDAELPELLTRIDITLSAAEDKLRAINPEDLYDVRFVGRRMLPTTVIGLIVHLAEHTQRHLGQAITLSKILRQAP